MGGDLQILCVFIQHESLDTEELEMHVAMEIVIRRLGLLDKC